MLWKYSSFKTNKIKSFAFVCLRFEECLTKLFENILDLSTYVKTVSFLTSLLYVHTKELLIDAGLNGRRNKIDIDYLSLIVDKVYNRSWSIYTMVGRGPDFKRRKLSGVVLDGRQATRASFIQLSIYIYIYRTQSSVYLKSIVCWHENSSGGNLSADKSLCRR